MHIELTNTQIKGFIHYVNGDYIIRSYKGDIYDSYDSGKQFHKIIDLASTLSDKIKLSNRLIRRLLRFYIYHVVPVKQYIVAFGLHQIYIISPKQNKIIETFPISGSRPLSICTDGEYVYYGEYFPNKNRRPVSIYRFKPLDKSVKCYSKISGIRHIHGMFYDRISGKIFLTTGDNDNESYIGYLESGKIKKYFSGSQQTRVVTLLFEESYIYFATDAPAEQNFIYRIQRENGELQKLQKIGGTVFYGASSNGNIVFSTVADTNKEQRQDVVELWVSKNGTDWKLTKEFAKDIWPKNLFQHGQLLISDKQYNSPSIWFTPFSTEQDQLIHKLTID